MVQQIPTNQHRRVLQLGQYNCGQNKNQTFVTVSGNLGGKVPVVNDVLSSNEQEIYPTNSFEEDYLEFEFQRDRNYYVNLRQTNLALKLNFVKARGYETYKTKEVKKNIIKKQKIFIIFLLTSLVL